MTCKEKVAQNNPECILEERAGGVKDCPYDYHYLPNYSCISDCEECWERESDPEEEW